MKQIIYPRIGETVYRETLPNGLPVCVVTKPGYRRAYALFATRYGGMDMRFALNGEWLDTPAGIAHYLEHKMFDTEEGNALQILAQNGAEPNAFTSNAVTAYYFDSTEHFFENLRVLLSFVSVPYFTDESVQKERGIISQEIGMIEDNPEWQVYKNLIGLLYRSSPARVPVAGSVESIAGITAQTLYDCHKAFYTPGNMCLTVVGDVDPQEVLRLAREVLPAESGPAIPRDYGEEEDLTPHEKEKTVRMEVSMPTFLLGFKCAPVGDGPEQMRQNLIGDLACDVLMGESSPLYARLYSEGLINGSFGYSFDILPGAAYLYAGGDSNDPRAVKAAILAETERLLKDGIDADYWIQLQRANFGSTLKSLNSFESVAMSAVEGCFHGYDPFQFPEFYESISRQDLLDFIRENICEDRAALSAIYPKEEPSASRGFSATGSSRPAPWRCTSAAAASTGTAFSSRSALCWRWHFACARRRNTASARVTSSTACSGASPAASSARGFTMCCSISTTSKTATARSAGARPSPSGTAVSPSTGRSSPSSSSRCA